ncbi:kinesin light chain-like [Wyeomyia smithii]|uniref:kinesin light chain-like n=1 Tax=Wyeomyia smithii TaxID=174621 RepID=UPI002468048C|nr:kinesin light chain-like [Wyeomyia smithii]
MALETIISNIRAVQNELEPLYSKYLSIAEGSIDSPTFDSEKLQIVKNSIANIEQALLDTQIMLLISSHTEGVEAENNKNRLRVEQLTKENLWLRDELKDTQQRLFTSEATVVQLQEEKKHAEFMVSLKRYDENPPNDGKNPDWIGLEEEPKVRSNRIASQASYEMPAKFRAVHNLIIQHAIQGNHQVVVPLCKQALEKLKRTEGRDHPDVATMLNILALVYRDQRKFDEAEGLLKEALAIREKSLGETHPAVAATLNNLTVLHGKRGKYREAEQFCKRALEIREQVLGEHHPDVAKQLNNLALLCQNQSKYYKAELYYKRALQIYTLLSPNDPNVVKTRNNLSSCYQKIHGKFKGGKGLYKHVLKRVHDNDSANEVSAELVAENQESNK